MKDKIKRWLGVVEPKDWSEDFDKLDKLVKDTMTKFSEIECSNCHKTVVTYPMGGGYHRLFDGTVLCADCGARHSVGKL